MRSTTAIPQPEGTSRMTSLLDYAPIAAAGFAVPQFLPQVRRLAAAGDTTGVSCSWAAPGQAQARITG